MLVTYATTTRKESFSFLWLHNTFTICFNTVSCICFQNGVYISSVISIPILLFCGFFIPMSTIPSYLQWLAYCSYARYTFQSVVLTIYSMDRPFLYCNKTICPFEDPKEIIKELDMEGELYVDYSALLGLFFFFRLATYLVLKFRVMRMQWLLLNQCRSSNKLHKLWFSSVKSCTILFYIYIIASFYLNKFSSFVIVVLVTFLLC